MQSDGKIIGIDFGTTNSVVAIVEGSEPQVIRSPEGDNKIPSIVGFLDNGEVVVGEKARRQAVTNPRRTVSSVKRLLGRSFEDVEESGDVFPYEIVNSDGSLLIDIDGMGYRPEQIGGLILRRIREIAESYAGEEITRAVITVPAYFDDLQRQSTIEAAKMAGLEVLRLINEPTAAAMAYGLGRSSDKEEIIAVYDFGGGTFDITILEISEKTFEVLCSTGDSHLGGDDLDNLIVNRIVEEFYNEHGLDLSKDPAVLRRLKEVAEKAKIELSSSKSARMSLPFFAQKDGQPIHLERSMDRDELEELIEPLVNRTIRCCRKALEDAGLSKKDVAKVVLVGGSTRIPLVQDAIEDFFGAAPFKGVNPDEVVALGAAAQAGVFEGNIQEVVLLDVTPHSLGIEVKDGKFSPIIEKNSTIPIKAAKTFTTTEANQSYVNIHILQGESTEAAENRSLGKFSLTNIPPAPAGVPRIRVTFFINADGVTEISASDLGSGIEKSLTVLHQQLNSDERSNRKRKRERSTKKLGGSMSTRRGAARSDGSGTKARTSSPGDTASLGGTPLRRPEPEKPKSDTQPMVPQSFAEISDSNPGALPPAAAAQQRAQEKLGTPAELVPPQRPMIATTASGEVPNLTPLPLPRRDSKADNPLPPLAPPPPGPSAAPAAQDSDDLPTTIESPLGSAAPVPPPPPRTPPAAPAPVLAATTPAAEDVPLPPAVESARADLLAKVDSPAAQAAYLGALKALDLEPYKSSRAYNVIAMRTRLQIAAGQSEEARESLKQLREAHLRTNVTELRELHDLALDRFAGTASIRRDRALLREMLSDWIGAADDIEQATRQDPNEGDTQILERVYKARMMEATDPGVQFKLVKIFLRTNRMDEAIEILQSLQRFESYQQRAVKILGLCHWQQNLHYLAWQKFKQLDLNDELKDILYRLAGDMERTEQLKNAVSVYEHLLANDPNYRDAAAKLKKLNFRLKLQDGEEDSPKVAGVLKDPRFTVIEEINRGSMGIIYKAKDKTLDEIVALKVLNDFLCQDPAAVERFKREARAAKKLSHPYIVRIHDMFESGSKRFISMEYIEGTDLKRLQAERTSITEEMILYYMDQIGDAMAYAHRLGVVHRDLKPANIMVTKQNVIKITDFGIAKLLKGEDGTKSGTAVIGTPLYMAPEQITGAGVDERSDIYSLGIVMYELASGNPPFYLGNIEYHHIHTAPPPLPDRVSPGLRAVILKAIEKDPAARYQNVDELLADLRKLRTTTGVPTK